MYLRAGDDVVTVGVEVRDRAGAQDHHGEGFFDQRGTFDDFPFEALVADMWKHHPGLVEAAEADLKGDFEHEAMVDR